MMSKQEAVGAIAEVDPFVTAHPRTNEVEQLEAMDYELAAPMFPRLLVDVMLPALPWYGRRKQDQAAMRHHIGNEIIGAALVEMLGNFQRLHQIEPPSE